jgi:hypothetical protein
MDIASLNPSYSFALFERFKTFKGFKSCEPRIWDLFDRADAEFFNTLVEI